jgi:hypothetical protein
MEKHMLTVSWNPDGFQVATIFPARASFNAIWFINRNLVPLRDHFFPGGRHSDQTKLMVQIENAIMQTAQMTRNLLRHNGLRKPAHTPDSPDRAPSDICLFGKVKSQLTGRSNQDEKELLHEMMTILGSVSTSELQDVFRNWMKRLEGAIETHGECVSQRTI